MLTSNKTLLVINFKLQRYCQFDICWGRIFITLNTDPCGCEDSLFIDPHHKHFIKGDLRIVETCKLRKFLTRGPNYREPRSTKFNKAFAKIAAGLDNCIRNLSSKTKCNVIDQWNKMILEKN